MLRISLRSILLSVLLAALISNYARDRRHMVDLKARLVNSKVTLHDAKSRLANDFGQGRGTATEHGWRAENLRQAAINQGWSRYDEVCHRHGHLRVDVVHSAYDDRIEGLTRRRLAYQVKTPANRNLALQIVVDNVASAPAETPRFPNEEPKLIRLPAGETLIEMLWDMEELGSRSTLSVKIDAVEVATYVSPLNDFGAMFGVPHHQPFTKRDQPLPRLARFMPSRDFAAQTYNSRTATIAFALVEAPSIDGEPPNGAAP